MTARARDHAACCDRSRWRAAAPRACDSPRTCRRGSRPRPGPRFRDRIDSYCRRSGASSPAASFSRWLRDSSSPCERSLDLESTRSFSLARLASSASNAVGELGLARFHAVELLEESPSAPLRGGRCLPWRPRSRGAPPTLPSRCGCGSSASAGPSSCPLRRRACLRCRGGGTRGRRARRDRRREPGAAAASSPSSSASSRRSASIASVRSRSCRSMVCRLTSSSI